MGGQIGIPLFYLQELRGIMMQFRDNFADQSLYWGWHTDQIGGGKTITELATGKLKIDVPQDIQARWIQTYNEAPKTIIGLGAYPCEIIVKMHSVNLGVNTMAGIYIAQTPSGTGSTNSMSFVRVRRDTPYDGLNVYQDNEAGRWWDTITDSPIFLRIRVGNFTWGVSKIIFSYSLNGVTWFDVWTDDGLVFTPSHMPGIGLFVANDTRLLSAYNAVSAQFEFFKMRTKSININ